MISGFFGMTETKTPLTYNSAKVYKQKDYVLDISICSKTADSDIIFYDMHFDP